MKQLRVVTSVDLIERGSELSLGLILAIPSLLYRAAQCGDRPTMDELCFTMAGDVFRKSGLQNAELKAAFASAALVRVATGRSDGTTTLVNVEFVRNKDVFWRITFSVSNSTIRYVSRYRRQEPVSSQRVAA